VAAATTGGCSITHRTATNRTTTNKAITNKYNNKQSMIPGVEIVTVVSLLMGPFQRVAEIDLCLILLLPLGSFCSMPNILYLHKGVEL
jgi:hypothetical protein